MMTDNVMNHPGGASAADRALLALSRANQRAAWRLIERLDVVGAWSRTGAEARLVESLRTGLLMTHLDVDFHVYSPTVSVGASFAAVAEIASHEGVSDVGFRNLLATEEQCLEWHLRVADEEGRTWQLDLIHMPSGSPFDGFFERVADRIRARLTPETRMAVLRLKHSVPEGMKVAGVEIYRAVLDGDVRTWDELMAWRNGHPLDGVDRWMP